MKRPINLQDADWPQLLERTINNHGVYGGAVIKTSIALGSTSVIEPGSEDITYLVTVHLSHVPATEDLDEVEEHLSDWLTDQLAPGAATDGRLFDVKVLVGQ